MGRVFVNIKKTVMAPNATRDKGYVLKLNLTKRLNQICDNCYLYNL